LRRAREQTLEMRARGLGELLAHRPPDRGAQSCASSGQSFSNSVRSRGGGGTLPPKRCGSSIVAEGTSADRTHAIDAETRASPRSMPLRATVGFAVRAPGPVRLNSRSRVVSALAQSWLAAAAEQ
jgi:hypothetical protein